MPAGYAHRRFGREVLALLPTDVRALLEAHRPLFDIGLHGPDIFFYYEPLHKNSVSRVGYAMHDVSGGQVFRRFLALWDKSGGSDAARAWLCGFLCHFALDSTCHGYVDQMAALGQASHYRLEMELDRALLELDGQDPVKTDFITHILPTEANARVIAPFFPQTTQNQVQKALKGMVDYHNLLLAPGKAKRLLLETGVKLLGKQDSFGDMIMSLAPDPGCRRLVAHLRELWDQALPLAAELIAAFPDLSHTQYRLDFGGRPAPTMEAL